MKRFTLVSGLLVLMATALIAENKQGRNYDFNNIKWGKDKEHVKKNQLGSNSVLILESEKTLIYLDIIEKQQCLITCFFIEDKLQRVIYTFIEQFSDSALYLEIYNKLQKSFTKKYGAPFSYEPVSRASTNGNHQEIEATFASSPKDKVITNVIWKSKKSIIELVLSGDNHNHRLAINFQSTKFAQQK